jgi:hypothetical protein
MIIYFFLFPKAVANVSIICKSWTHAGLYRHTLELELKSGD